MTVEPLSVNTNPDETEGQPNSPDIDSLSASPESTGDEFRLLDRVPDYHSSLWDKDDENWKQGHEQRDKKHLEELLDKYQSNLHSIQKRKSMLGPGDSNLTTLENQEKDCEQKIRDLKAQLFGGYFKDEKESKRFQERSATTKGAISPSQEFSDWFSLFSVLDFEVFLMLHSRQPCLVPKENTGSLR